MPSKQHLPCALVAGDPPSVAARRITVLVIMLSLVFSAYLVGEDHERVLLVLLTWVGAPAGLVINGPLMVLNLRFRRFRLGIEAVGDI